MSDKELIRLVPVPAANRLSSPKPMNELSRRKLLQSLGIGAAALVFLPALDRRAAHAQDPVTDGSAPVFTSRLQLPFWGDAASWNEEECYATIQAGRRMFPKTRQSADIDRDGRDELTGRGITGIVSNTFDPDTGQWIQLPFGPQWSNADSWTGEQYYRTIQLGDIDGDGHAELLGRAGDGMRPFKYVVDPVSGSGTWNALPTLDGFSDDQGWGRTPYSGTLQCADLDGDGADEVIGRGIGQLAVWKFRPSSSNPLEGTWVQIQFNNSDPGWTNFNGWLNPGYFETIQCAKISTGAGKILLGRAPGGLEAWRLTIASGSNSGTWTQLATIDDLSDSGNWNHPEYYETIQCADIDGDGRDELLARAGDGMRVWKYGGDDGQTDAWVSLPRNGDLSDGANWNQAKYYQTIQLADLDGDGRAELIGRASDSLRIWSYDTDAQGNSAWNQRQSGPAWADGTSDAKGWDAVEYYSSIQTARALKPGDVGYTGDGTHTQSVLLARGTGFVETWRLDRKPGQSGTWYQTSVPYQALSGGTLLAYESITRFLGIQGTGANGIRARYSDSSGVLREWQERLSAPSTAPQGVNQADWDQVRTQIARELLWAGLAQDWYNNLIGTQITNTFLSESLTLYTVGPYLQFNSGNTTQLVLSILALVAGAIAAVLGFPELEAGAAVAVAGVIGTAFSAASQFLPGRGTDGFQGQYNQLQGQLRDSFSQALVANGNNLRAIVGSADRSGYTPGDYGLLSAVGQMIESSVWSYEGADLGRLALAASRSYAISIWQTLLKAVLSNNGSQWFIVANSYDPFAFPSNSVPDVSVYKGGREVNYQGQSIFLKSWEWMQTQNADTYLSQDTLRALFGDPVPDSVFPLGASKPDAFLFQNGWPTLNFYDKSADYEPNVPSVLGALPAAEADLRMTTALARDTDTGEIVVTLSLFNEGFTPATNIRVIQAQINGQNATLLPARYKRLAHRRSLQMEMRFPAFRAGTRVVLRIAGVFGGGTFGGSFRVTAP